MNDGETDSRVGGQEHMSVGWREDHPGKRREAETSGYSSWKTPEHHVIRLTLAAIQL